MLMSSSKQSKPELYSPLDVCMAARNPFGHMCMPMPMPFLNPFVKKYTNIRQYSIVGKEIDGKTRRVRVYVVSLPDPQSKSTVLQSNYYGR